MTRAALLLPGRGSYTEASLGSLPPQDPWVQEAEALRVEFGLTPLCELDQATRFEPARHLEPSNVSALIYVKSMLDARAASERYEVVCVGGNSMGWYTALAAAGALEFADGFRLVQRMSLLQEEGAPGGQVIYPVVDADWRPDPAAEAAVEAALAAHSGEAFPSIRLGGYRVLAGSPAGVTGLLEHLPRVSVGKVTYPFRLALHGPYHTALAQSVADAAARELAVLAFRAPRIALVDGFGRRHSPWSTDVDLLRLYTLGSQVTDPFDFSATVRVALREWAPERLVLTGPGNSLGGVVGQVLCAEGWGGVHDRDEFLARQAGDTPLVDSMGR